MVLELKYNIISVCIIEKIVRFQCVVKDVGVNEVLTGFIALALLYL